MFFYYVTVAARGSDAAPAAVTVTVTVSATVAIKAGSRWLPVAPSLRLTFTKHKSVNFTRAQCGRAAAGPA